LRPLPVGQVRAISIDLILGVSKPILGEMAKRIWWSMYALEVESSLNCGRPSIPLPKKFSDIVCIRNQDIFIDYPTTFDDEVALVLALLIERLSIVRIPTSLLQRHVPVSTILLGWPDSLVSSARSSKW
jgi:hypothetical protein